jgi:menaquinone-specific isochorismate synthase
MRLTSITDSPVRSDLADLRSVTVRLDDPTADRIESAVTRRDGLEPDTALFQSPDRLIVGIGAAARFRLARATQPETSHIVKALATIMSEDPIGEPGSSPIAIGALPFNPSSPGELVVPSFTFVRNRNGLAWLTLTGKGPLVAPNFGSAPEAPPKREVPPGAGAAEILDSGGESFTEAVEAALKDIRAGRIAKVVLARRVTVSFSVRVDVAATIDALRRREPLSTIFAISSDSRTFVGASPELLVAKNGPHVASVPLAGSVAMSGERAGDEIAVAGLLASAKENLEHRLVVEAVEKELSRWCASVVVQPEPEVLSLRTIAHLATSITGRLRGGPDSWPSALALATSLHPTPAVSGSPIPAALELIAELEPTGRGLYAGPVGWVDSSGDGEFVLGIRSAEVSGNSATVYAGAGIVEGSDPFSELDETSVKLQTMLDALTA